MRGKLAAVLDADEPALAWFEPDLDPALNFFQGLVVLTGTRVVGIGFSSLDAGTFSAPQSPAEARAWDLSAEMSLRIRELGGAAALELVDAKGLLAQWRYTPANAKAAHHFVDRWKLLRSGTSTNSESSENGDAHCPRCGGPLNGEQGICEACAALPEIKAGRSLLRLLSFARKRGSMASLGIGLTIASTAASMVPPYLTRPMMDDVLIPFTEKGVVNTHLVPWLLGGLALASILTWILSWGRTYVIAWVSERVAVDLRNQTYAHLQSMSLEYFGGKRTGDLISRVSSDSDRICYFLSVNLLDFANDVLTFVMTAIILLLIDWRLALATLIPLPVIAYLVHGVRSRLRRGFSAGQPRFGLEMTSCAGGYDPRHPRRHRHSRKSDARSIASASRRPPSRVRHRQRPRQPAPGRFFGPVITLLTDAGLLVVSTRSWACGSGFSAWPRDGRHVEPVS